MERLICWRMPDNEARPAMVMEPAPEPEGDETTQAEQLAARIESTRPPGALEYVEVDNLPAPPDCLAFDQAGQVVADPVKVAARRRDQARRAASAQIKRILDTADQLTLLMDAVDALDKKSHGKPTDADNDAAVTKGRQVRQWIKAVHQAAAQAAEDGTEPGAIQWPEDPAF